FYAWFDGELAGDFVVSVGGFHPSFRKPDHYPSVPRLGFVWQVTDDLSFKGEMYAALTPVAIMAGGAIQAAYDTGPLSAWFKAGLNFIIYWQPFYYEADFSVSIGAKVELDMGFLGSVSFNTELGANLKIWGPEFSGIAEVNWAIFEFTIRFGDSDKPGVAAIGWSDFEGNYIPKKASDLVEINVVKGERSVVDGWHLVDPDEFELVIGSQIPLNRASVDGQQTAGKGFNLAPMDAASVKDWTMTVTSKGVDGVTFIANKIDKQYPKAVWGSKFKPNIGEEGTTMALLSGVKVLASPGKPPGFTEAVDADEFKFSDVVENDPYWQWGVALNRVSNSDTGQNGQIISDTLTKPEVVSRRNSIATFF
ncbi:MAG: hypothetical protein MJK04_01805, partial [Psychrosphaera sp.]|nr:hypothetical protein [Psychrosphaera sp.]